MRGWGVILPSLVPVCAGLEGDEEEEEDKAKQEAEQQAAAEPAAAEPTAAAAAGEEGTDNGIGVADDEDIEEDELLVSGCVSTAHQ